VYRRWSEGKQRKEEKRYYITSLDAEAEKLGEKVRRHWSVENEFHWHLDVTFGEDKSQISAEANENLRIARAIALRLLKAETTCKMGIKAKMRKCLRSEKYLHQVLLVGNF
jgi:predicted transposase YbfD/YdcC